MNSDPNRPSAPSTISQSEIDSRYSLDSIRGRSVRPRIRVGGELCGGVRFRGAALDIEEHEAGECAADELREPVFPNVAEADGPVNDLAERDRRVERGAGDRADGERAGKHGETDREAEVRVALGLPGGRDVQHHVGERER